MKPAYDKHPASLLREFDAVDSKLVELTKQLTRRTDLMLNGFADLSVELDALLASQQIVIRRISAGHVHIVARQRS